MKKQKKLQVAGKIYSAFFSERKCFHGEVIAGFVHDKVGRGATGITR
jgi:hypothetical protein